MDYRGITIIGGGEIVKTRYLPAVHSCGLKVRNIIDTRVFQADSFGEDCRTHVLHDRTPDGVLELLSQLGLKDNPVIVATPSFFHVPYATALLRGGYHVALEKPFAVSKQQITDLDSTILDCSTDRLFLLGYYALEKGLPAIVVSKGKNVPQDYLDLISPTFTPEEIGKLREQLGAVISIDAVLLEAGEGISGTLNHRPWVLDSSTGGNSLETFYHLVCMSLPYLGNPDTVSVKNAHVAKHLETSQWYSERYARDSAETLTTAQLSNNAGVKVNLACAKYVPGDLRQRWMRINFENGSGFMNFEDNTFHIKTTESSIILGLKNTQRYTSQLNLFRRKLEHGDSPVEYKLFRDALLLTLDIRDKGLRGELRDIPIYGSHNLDQNWLDTVLNRL